LDLDQALLLKNKSTKMLDIENNPYYNWDV